MKIKHLNNPCIIRHNSYIIYDICKFLKYLVNSSKIKQKSIEYVYSLKINGENEYSCNYL